MVVQIGRDVVSTRKYACLDNGICHTHSHPDNAVAAFLSLQICFYTHLNDFVNVILNTFYKIINRGTNVNQVKFCKYFFVSLHNRNFTAFSDVKNGFNDSVNYC